MRSFHIFFAVRLARSRSACDGPRLAPEVLAALSPAPPPMRATRSRRPGTLLANERNASFSLRRAAPFFENARASASRMTASASHVSGSRLAMVPMSASTGDAGPAHDHGELVDAVPVFHEVVHGSSQLMPCLARGSALIPLRYPTHVKLTQIEQLFRKLFDDRLYNSASFSAFSASVPLSTACCTSRRCAP